ncbi:MAG: type II toxin-antitoxin system CcdA family antitoxin, partial [Candidatus Bathyarchaeia archaeon]
MKVRTSILIEDEVLKSAQKLGLNVSQCCENALKLYINALTGANQKIAKNLVDRAGFEPATSAVRGLTRTSSGFLSSPAA